MGTEPHPVLLVLTGPSGAGKTTVAQRLLAENKNLKRVVTCTTRAPREEEANGKDYHFFAEEEFSRRVTLGEFLEHADVYGQRYGTLRASVDALTAAGLDVLLVNDIQGAETVMKAIEDLTTVFLKTETLEDLRERLENRAAEDVAEIEKRLTIAEVEMARANEFDHVVSSGTKEEDWRRVQEIYEKAKQR